MSLSTNGCRLAAIVGFLLLASRVEADDPRYGGAVYGFGVPARSPVVLGSGIVRNPYIGVPPSRPFYGVRPSSPYGSYSPGYARQRYYGSYRPPLPSSRLYGSQSPYAYRGAPYDYGYRDYRSYRRYRSDGGYAPGRGARFYRGSGGWWIQF